MWGDRPARQRPNTATADGSSTRGFEDQEDLLYRVLVVFPNAWDTKQLRSCGAAWEGRYRLQFGEPTDEDCPWDFDILGYIDRLIEGAEGIDGVTSSSDYPGATVAGAVAAGLGLPGTPAERVIRCSHKYYSRLAQRESVPEATPWFRLLDPDAADPAAGLDFPCFIKPVKGAFSVMSGRVDGLEELAAFLDRPALRHFLDVYLDIFNRLVAGLTSFEIDGRHFLVEELLHGAQVTVEGYCHGDAVEIIGIVDSATDPRTGSFVRFDYPSALAPSVQRRMSEIAGRVVRHLGLRQTLFNIEMIYDEPRDRICIIEINPRVCGQFADLYQKVDGTSSYEIALALAAGEPPRVKRRAGAYARAASFPLRIFEPAVVRRAPSSREIAEVEGSYPGALVWSECETGQLLADFESVEDGKSCRYAIVNLGASSNQDLSRRFEEVRAALGYELLPA